MKRKTMHRLSIALTALFIISGIVAPSVRGAEISIYNSPPTFVDIKIIDTDERIQVVVEVSDMNGWEDIWKVYVNVTDMNGNLVESALYQQYMTNSSGNRVDLFSDSSNYLIPGESDVMRFPFTSVSSKDWFNATYQKITFVFRPFSGYYIHVEAFDKKSNKCEYSGPFSSKYEIPPVVENPVVPLGISLVIAAGTGAGIYVHRRHSNRLAQLAEEKTGG